MKKGASTFVIIVLGVFFISLANASNFDNNPDKISDWDFVDKGNVTNIYNNISYINQTANLTNYYQKNETYNSTWIDSIFVKLSNLVSLVGNWTLDKPNYDNITIANSKYCFSNGTNSLGQNCTNLTGYVKGNMSAETITTNTTVLTTNYSLYFDGSNDYVEIPLNENLKFVNQDFSASFWINPTVDKSAATILDFESGGWKGWLIRRAADNSWIGGCLALGGGYGERCVLNGFVSLNQWSHVVVIYSESEGKLYGYLNGDLNKTVDINLDLTPSVTNFGIGNNVENLEQGWQGKIDEVSIFNRSLNSTEVSQLYNNGNGLYSDTSVVPFNNGLVAGYHFDEGNGTTTTDVLGNYNGTLNNDFVDGKIARNVTVSTSVLGDIGLMPWVSATNFISTDYSLQWLDNTLKNPWNNITNLGNSTNRWNIQAENISVKGSRGLTGNYSIGSCWQKFTEGVLIVTNCTSL